MKRITWVLIGVVFVTMLACRKKLTEPESNFTTEQESIDFPKIDRRPDPLTINRGAMSSIPQYDTNSNEQWQMDLRWYNLNSLDLSNSLDDLMFASFNDRTVWPPANRMPSGFNYQQIMELGKDPGLGVRTLHQRGVTGRRVGIAIIDQPLLTSHREYSENLRLYEEINIDSDRRAAMHGAAVASIAVGQSMGVAPAADLYYIASVSGITDPMGEFFYDFQYKAQAVHRVIEINEQLPEDRKIRVITIQNGWSSNQAGYTEITAAVQEAIDAGFLVVNSSIEESHGFKFHGLGRHPMADPYDFESLEPGLFWLSSFLNGWRFNDRLLVPMDSRTTASPTNEMEYVFYRRGGWSWAIPYIGGMYALAAQANPDITPDLFWAKALETGRTITIEHQGESIPFGPILDAVALVDAL